LLEIEEKQAMRTAISKWKLSVDIISHTTPQEEVQVLICLVAVVESRGDSP